MTHEWLTEKRDQARLCIGIWWWRRCAEVYRDNGYNPARWYYTEKDPLGQSVRYPYAETLERRREEGHQPWKKLPKLPKAWTVEATEEDGP